MESVGSNLRRAPALTPHGHLILSTSDEALPLDPGLAESLAAAFARGSGHGLLHLGAAGQGTIMPGTLASVSFTFAQKPPPAKTPR